MRADGTALRERRAGAEMTKLPHVMEGEGTDPWEIVNAVCAADGVAHMDTTHEERRMAW